MFAPLIDFAGRLCHRTPGSPVSKSSKPSETFEEIDESLHDRFRKSSEKYVSQVSRLFDVIWANNLSPCDPDLAESLPSEFESLVAQAKQRLERKVEKRDEIEYAGQKCLLIETMEPKSDDEYKQLGFPYVIVRDANSFHIRISFFGSGESNLKFIQRQAHKYKFRDGQNQDGQPQLISKEPMPDLSLDKMKEIIEAAETERVSWL